MGVTADTAIMALARSCFSPLPTTSHIMTTWQDRRCHQLTSCLLSFFHFTESHRKPHIQSMTYMKTLQHGKSESVPFPFPSQGRAYHPGQPTLINGQCDEHCFQCAWESLSIPYKCGLYERKWDSVLEHKLMHKWKGERKGKERETIST